MIDLHAHILPELDDGAANMDESIEMARLYCQTGYRFVVATPHFIVGSSYMPTPDRIIAQAAALNRALNQEKIDLTVGVGMEIAMDADIPALVLSNRLLTLADSSYLLVETPFQQLPLGWNQIIFNFLSQGYQVLLAHPERCAQVINDPAIIDEMIAAGCFIQGNWSSLSGLHGPESEALLNTLVHSGRVHCLATDTHNTTSRNAGLVADTSARLLASLGRKNFDVIVHQNPAGLLQSQPLTSIEPLAARTPHRRKRFSWWPF